MNFLIPIIFIHQYEFISFTLPQKRKLSPVVQYAGNSNSQQSFRGFTLSYSIHEYNHNNHEYN